MHALSYKNIRAATTASNCSARSCLNELRHCQTTFQRRGMLGRCTKSFLFLHFSMNSLIQGKVKQYFLSLASNYFLGRQRIYCYSTLGFDVDRLQESHDQSIKKISSSFKQWFMQCKPAQSTQMQTQVEDINSILSRGNWGSETEYALKSLNLTLTEQCVVRVLKLQRDAALGIKFFEWAGQQRGYSHSVTAYYTVFKMLSRAGLSRVIEEWLDSYRRQNPGSGPRLYSILIMGYSFAGKSGQALKLFGRMRFQNLSLDKFTYSVLVRILAKQNSLDFIEAIEKRMPQGSGGRIGDCVKIQGLCKMGRIDEAKDVLDELRRNSFPVDEVSVVSLVYAFCKEGRMDEVGLLIDELREEQVIRMSKVYEIWIKHLVDENRVNEALDYFKERVSEGFDPGPRCYGALVTGLLRWKRRKEVYCLLNEMRDKHVCPDTITINVAISFFCRGKFVDIAMDLFNERSKIGFSLDKFTYSKLINELCRMGKMDEAYKVLEDGMEAGFFPGKHTLVILVNAFCKAGKLDILYKLLDAGIERQCVPDYSTSTKIISILCQSGRLDDGYLLLGKLRKMNVVLNRSAYYALIDGFCDVKRGDMASKLLLEMKESGHMPGRLTLKIVFSVLCETGQIDQALQLLDVQMFGSPPDTGLYNKFIKIICQAGRPNIAIRILEKMLDDNCTPNGTSYINLLHGYLRSKSVVNALNLFRELLAENIFPTKLYNVMIGGLCMAEKLELALMFFEEMIRKRLIPSLGCYEKLIYALCKEGKLNMALKLFGAVKKRGYRCCTFIYNVLLGHSFKLREVNQAWFLFDDMRKQNCPPNVATFGILIAGLSDARRLESTIGVLEEMMEQSFTADIFIYNMLLRGLCKEGKLELACDLFNRMPKKGCAPNASTYNSLIYGLSRAGRIYDAQKLMSEMLEKKMLPKPFVEDGI